jgi:E3 ubiquitin-protein ligase UBR1
VIIEWLLDLSRSRLGTDTIVIRETIAAELLSPRKRDSFTKHLTPATALNLDGEIVNPTRIGTLSSYSSMEMSQIELEESLCFGYFDKQGT